MSVYVCELSGHDSLGTGSEKMPFKTTLKALQVFTAQSLNEGIAKVNVTSEAADTSPVVKETPPILVRKDHVEGFKPIANAAFKKAKKLLENEEKKRIKQEELRLKEERERKGKAEEEAKRVEDSKKIVIENPGVSAVKIKIRQGEEFRGQRIVTCGWIHNIRVQGKDMMFLVVRDGSGLLQCLLQGKLCHTYDALTLTRETTIRLYGVLTPVPEGKAAPGGHELVVDYYEIIGKAPSGEDSYENQFNEESNPDVLLNLRHLVIRGDKASSMLKMRNIVLKSFRSFFESRYVTEVSPPLMVQTQVEGGSTLFKFSYYGEDAYLTQSSQLYLETTLASVGDSYCIAESFRAENSHTRRHLSQFTHCEAEFAFIDFNELLQFIEDMIVGVVSRVFEDPLGRQLMQELNPDFKIPSTPFKRMTYVEAIEWLNKHEIKNAQTGNDFVFGEDIPELPERRMTDTIGQPILLCKFPVEIKSFYMKKCPDDARLTESVDVLMPNVGEIVGGSMRISDLAELIEGYKREGIDPAPYYWFTDQRKYGTGTSGGFGLGVERFLAWLVNAYSVRDVCWYPRFPGRCQP